MPRAQALFHVSSADGKAVAVWFATTVRESNVAIGMNIKKTHSFWPAIPQTKESPWSGITDSLITDSLIWYYWFFSRTYLQNHLSLAVFFFFNVVFKFYSVLL